MALVEIPRVGPLGLIHHPENYSATARRYPTRRTTRFDSSPRKLLRVAAFAVLGSFVAVTVITTTYSLGAYCLTTWGGNPFAGF